MPEESPARVGSAPGDPPRVPRVLPILAHCSLELAARTDPIMAPPGAELGLPELLSGPPRARAPLESGLTHALGDLLRASHEAAIEDHARRGPHRFLRSARSTTRDPRVDPRIDLRGPPFPSPLSAPGGSAHPWNPGVLALSVAEGLLPKLNVDGSSPFTRFRECSVIPPGLDDASGWVESRRAPDPRLDPRIDWIIGPRLPSRGGRRRPPRRASRPARPPSTARRSPRRRAP